jgi:polar amino acid transport system ATP-binding protein
MIEFKDVHKKYGDLTVLNGLSTSFERSQVTCLLGPSGSGKSTLLRCINGLETYDSGSILFDGELISSTSKSITKQRKRMPMVFQRFNLFPHRTVLENVTEALIYVHGVDRKTARERGIAVLERVGLAGKLQSYPQALSGGQQQRVAIARALAVEPEVVLFDEPTSALDPELVGEVLSTMRGLADAGISMLVVTHEINFALEVSDKVVFLANGRIEESGTPHEVIRNPQSERTKQFLKRIS